MRNAETLLSWVRGLPLAALATHRIVGAEMSKPGPLPAVTLDRASCLFLPHKVPKHTQSKKRPHLPATCIMEHHGTDFLRGAQSRWSWKPSPDKLVPVHLGGDSLRQLGPHLPSVSHRASMRILKSWASGLTVATPRPAHHQASLLPQPASCYWCCPGAQADMNNAVSRGKTWSKFRSSRSSANCAGGAPMAES